MSVKCAIIDDEPLARKVIRQYLGHVSWAELVFEEGNPLKAIDRLKEEPVDLLFLDVKMPGITGLDLLSIVQNRPEVILTTAYRDYALEGFEYEVTDYLLKPIALERFLRAIHKVREKKMVTPELPQQTARRSIILKQDKKLFKVSLDNITHIEGLKDYVKVHTTAGLHITHYTLQAILKDLHSEDFMRVHKSFIINLNHFQSLDGGMITVQESRLPLGRTYREDFIQRITSS
jgi:DNA-binding LytR/AlgR family response regulator